MQRSDIINIRPVKLASTVMLLVGLLVPLLGLGGCGDECSSAQDLCEDCEQVVANCTRFERSSAEDCQKAVDAYEVSCPEG